MNTVLRGVLFLIIPVVINSLPASVLSASEEKGAGETTASESDAAASLPPQTAEPSNESQSTVVGPGTSAGEIRIFTEMKIPFCWCPPGKFQMGSPTDEPGHRSEEKQTEVELTQGFWIQQYELTQENWNSIARRRPWEDADPYRYRTGSQLPADYIDWYEAMSYCQMLTDLEREEGGIVEGQRFQLPTEAQWEYACRAGTTTAFSFGNDISVLKDHAWFLDNTWDAGEGWPHEAGTRKPNGWGIHDMHGNVWEWCVDRFVVNPPGGINPYTVGSGRSQRTCRGGCWNTPPESLRSAARGELSSTGVRFSGIGFRMVLVLSADMELKTGRTESLR
jgi:sulfatase modifying factor 1